MTTYTDVKGSANKFSSLGRVWIDLENSPHVPFFTPIVAELQKRGYSVMVTARDCFQVRELADLFGVKYKLVGRHFGRSRILKIAGLGLRTLQLIRAMWQEKPDIAVSHCSRAQLTVAALLGITSVQIGDYEFASGWSFIQPSWHMCPAIIPSSAIPLDKTRLVQYPGIKEDVYVPSFLPSPGLRRQLGLTEDDLVVTMRPPATEAHYHNPESDHLLEAAIMELVKKPEVRIVMTPRNEKQGNQLRNRWANLFANGKMRIPTAAPSGLNLIWHSDLVISGGGTMNREAAALGVPVYSIFRGRIGAVDRYLSSMGRFILLESAEDVRKNIRIECRDRSHTPQISDSAALKAIVNHIVSVMNVRPLSLASATLPKGSAAKTEEATA